MNEIRELCETYKHHLEFFDYELFYEDEIKSRKKGIVKTILVDPNPRRILNILRIQRSHSESEALKTLSYEEFLKIRRSFWLKDALIGIILVLTFPVSVPFLMLWSWSMRGDVNFFKPDGAIFVEKLQFLCEQADPQAQTAFSLSANFHTLSRSTPVNDYKSLVPQVNLKPRRTALTTNTKEDGGFFGGLFDSSSHLSDSGDPELLSFRMHPFAYYDDNFILVDVFCKFRFIPNLTKGTSLKLRFDLRPSYLSAQSSSLAGLPFETKEVQETTTQAVDVLQTIQNYFFKPKPPETFETVYAAAQETRCDVLKVGRRALELARNDTQRVMALEFLINILKHKYDYHCAEAKNQEISAGEITNRLKRYKDYKEGRYVPSTELERIEIERLIQENEDNVRCHGLPLWEEMLHKAEYWTQININESERYLQGLSEALDSLPANYRSITPSANQLQATFDLMFRLLENNQIGDAEILYQRNENLSYFLETAFPHFKALLQQFRGTFFLVSQLGAYAMLDYDSEPTDCEIKKNTLIVYCKDNQVWAAARHPDNQIHRFAIDSNRLGNKTAETVLDEFEKRGDSMLKPILADYGYYDIFWPSIINARGCFLLAHEYIQSYDAGLAERFERETLGPLQALIDFGQKARERTPVDIQLQMIERHSQKCDKEMLSGGVVSSQPSILSDAAWDELLADSIETLQQEETADGNYGIRF